MALPPTPSQFETFNTFAPTDIREAEEMDRWQNEIRAATPRCGFRLGWALEDFLQECYHEQVREVRNITIQSIARMNLLGLNTNTQKFRLRYIDQVIAARSINITEAT